MSIITIINRRISRYLMGYRRPPFTLYRLPRERVLFFKFLYSEAYQGDSKTYQSNMRWGWFAQTVIPEDSLFANRAESVESVESVDRTDRGCYLWPDALKWYFFSFALILATPLALDCTIAGFVAAFISFFSILLVLPFCVFYLCRIPLLDYLQDKLPSSANKKIRNSIEQRNITALFFINLNFIKEKWDQVHYSPNTGSFKESLIRVALRDMFQKPPYENIATTWYSRAFFRWLFYWCSPVWGSYLILWLITIGLVVNEPCPSQVSLINNLAYSGTLWVVFSAFYIRKVAAELEEWTVLKTPHYRHLPSVLSGKIRTESFIVSAIAEKNITMIISLISGFLAATYLGMIKFFIFAP